METTLDESGKFPNDVIAKNDQDLRGGEGGGGGEGDVDSITACLPRLPRFRDKTPSNLARNVREQSADAL